MDTRRKDLSITPICLLWLVRAGYAFDDQCTKVKPWSYYGHMVEGCGVDSHCRQDISQTYISKRKPSKWFWGGGSSIYGVWMKQMWKQFGSKFMIQLSFIIIDSLAPPETAGCVESTAVRSLHHLINTVQMAERQQHWRYFGTNFFCTAVRSCTM